MHSIQVDSIPEPEVPQHEDDSKLDKAAEILREARSDPTYSRWQDADEEAEERDAGTGIDLSDILHWAENRGRGQVDAEKVKELREELKGLADQVEPEAVEQPRERPEPRPVLRPPGLSPEEQADLQQSTGYRTIDDLAVGFHSRAPQILEQLREEDRLLSQAAEEIEQLRALDPLSAAELRMSLDERIAQFQEKARKLDGLRQKSLEHLHKASARACGLPDHPSEAQLKPLVEFAVKELGLGQEEILRVASDPRLARAVAQAFRASQQPQGRGRRTGRKRGRGAIPSANAIEQALQRREAAAGGRRGG